ncbi:glycosyltransferase [Actinomadura xylanilytica]|uniref:glycosyltransferase n=1 Tax=Actinomadura xylanilytica TaxID=887459 RepID=UPI00255A97DF|nr:glycosyltransferase [Actinomadura xylanilytica]MDL4773221.1 glycosyltransferase [Actinomadura xylanilytica]
MDGGRDLFLVCNNVEVLGGVQTWAHFMARLFTGRGHCVHVVGIMHPKRTHDHGADFPYATTVLHPHFPGGGWKPKGLRDLTSPRARRLRSERLRGAAGLAALLRTARPGGMVIVAEVWAMEWVRRAAPGHLKVIGMVHESHAACRLAGRHDRVLRHFADADRFLTLTLADADAFARDGMANADFIPNALHVVPARHAELDAPVVVRLGRLDYDKGQDLLLDAWSKVAPRRPGWTLRVHGSDKCDGKEERRLARMTEELGLTGSVQWPGPTRDIETALCAGSVFALTSREEGFPMAILEAMAYGLPCVAFDCAPGIGELITHGVDGLVVPAGNTTEFAACLLRLMDDAELRRKMGRAARASVQRFAPDAVAGRWEELFAFLS